MGLKKLQKTCRFVAQSLLTRKPRIGYIGGFQGHRNLGDEALYAALKRLFSFGNFIDYNRRLVPNFMVGLLPKCDVMLMGGGTSVCGYREITLQWAKTCFPCAPHRVIFGSGVVCPDFVAKVVGPSYDVHKQWADVLRQCDYIGVRGPMSKKILEELGLQNVEVIGDPVMTHAVKELPKAVSGKDNVIGLNVGLAGGNLWGREDYICRQFVKLAKIAGRSGFRVKWFVVRPGDLDAAKQVAAESAVPADICEFYEDFDAYLNAVASVTVFVGMKLHAVALANCACVPSVMLEYNPKCRDYMEAIGHQRYTLRTDKFTADEVWELVKYLLDNRAVVAGSLFEAVTKFRKLQFSRASQIIANLGFKPACD